MRNFIFVLLVAVAAIGAIVVFAKPGDDLCRNIQSGELYRWNELLGTGFDSWGYNYQGHGFNGAYCDHYRDFRPGSPGNIDCEAAYSGLKLQMRWNDEYLSNKDCIGGDGHLDLHPNFPSYLSSGATLSATLRGTYQHNSEVCELDYTIKIFADPRAAIKDDEGLWWYTIDGKELGPVLWEDFVITRELEKNSCNAINGRDLITQDWQNE
ncbi:MAG: hypothetical protein KAJ48_07230 [Elusimicrobiales bacterium]|nr:hypothetical protein [Elusimicrobiales bacterium]